MGIKRIQLVEVNCDKCNNAIDDGAVWLDICECGIVVHWICLQEMSALDFIALVMERGDQMWVKVDTREMLGVELKHIWNDAMHSPDQMRLSVLKYRQKYSKDY